MDNLTFAETLLLLRSKINKIKSYEDIKADTIEGMVDLINNLSNHLDIKCKIFEKRFLDLEQAVEDLKQEVSKKYWYKSISHNGSQICLTVTSTGSQEVRELNSFNNFEIIKVES